MGCRAGVHRGGRVGGRLSPVCMFVPVVSGPGGGDGARSKAGAGGRRVALLGTVDVPQGRAGCTSTCLGLRPEGPWSPGEVASRHL